MKDIFVLLFLDDVLNVSNYENTIISAMSNLSSYDNLKDFQAVGRLDTGNADIVEGFAVTSSPTVVFVERVSNDDFRNVYKVEGNQSYDTIYNNLKSALEGTQPGSSTGGDSSGNDDENNNGGGFPGPFGNGGGFGLPKELLLVAAIVSGYKSATTKETVSKTGWGALAAFLTYNYTKS